MDGFSEYGHYDALGLANLVRGKQVRPGELLEEAIARAQRVNPQLNALICERFDAARTDAAAGLPSGAFCGVPFLAKDLGPRLGGIPMRMGSRYFNDYVPDVDDEFFTRIKCAGLNIFGKTSTPEFGLLPYTEPQLFGPCRNPWDPERTPGGSSGGSAALIAAGVVPMAHGNDMGGSLRIPASCTGLFGFKPSRGLVPRRGTPIADMNVDLAITRSVRDSAALLDAVGDGESAFRDDAGRDPGRLRVALVQGTMLGHSIDARCRSAAQEAAALCERLGHHVEIAEPSGIDYEAAGLALLLIFASNVAWIMNAGNPLRKKLRAGDLEPETWAMLTIAQVLSAADLTDAVQTQVDLAQRFDAFLQQYDVMLMPTLAAPPVPIGEFALSRGETAQIEVLGRLRSGALIRKGAETIAQTLFDWIPYAPVFNMTGQPAMSVPLYWTQDDLPIGVHFAARVGNDALLYRLAAQLEAAQPWFSRRPPIHA
ncbi:MAG TPA: amidase [Candidatus Baltobacteraceae bacterium]|nr:amidase [Candidatus Baltobacteraceae bacterium]